MFQIPTTHITAAQCQEQLNNQSSDQTNKWDEFEKVIEERDVSQVDG